MTTMTSEVLGLPHGRPLTYADLQTMPDDGHRYELIDGVLIVSPAPITAHQRAVMRLMVRLHTACPDSAELFSAPFDVVLADDTVMQPDLLLARSENLTDRNLQGPPLLALEVLSASTRDFDLAIKKARLARAGCPHYWVVDLEVPSILAWTLVDGGYTVAAEARGEQEFAVVEPLEIGFRPSDLVR